MKRFSFPKTLKFFFDVRLFHEFLVILYAPGPGPSVVQELTTSTFEGLPKVP